MKKKWDPATEGEAYKLFLLLNQTADGLRKLRQRSLENCGITMEQAAALICVKRLGENATSAELSKWLFREPNTVTALVNGMEKKGLLRRTPSPENKKIKILSLTESGTEALRFATDADYLHSTILQLTPAKRRQLTETLEQLRDVTFLSLQLDLGDYIHFRDMPNDFLREQNEE